MREWTSNLVLWDNNASNTLPVSEDTSGVHVNICLYVWSINQFSEEVVHLLDTFLVIVSFNEMIVVKFTNYNLLKMFGRTTSNQGMEVSFHLLLDGFSWNFEKQTSPTKGRYNSIYSKQHEPRLLAWFLSKKFPLELWTFIVAPSCIHYVEQ